MRYQTFINGEWIEQAPTENGQLYRAYDNSGGMVQSYWSVLNADNRAVFTISEESVTINGNAAALFAGSYYCEPNDAIQLIGSITDADGNVVTDINIPVTLKMPMVRNANGQPTTDEIYLNVTLHAGVMTASGKLPWSGDWKILIERVNEALLRIGANWKLQHPDITFLA